MLYVYRATRDARILELAFLIVDRLDLLTRTECGFANIQKVLSLEKEDKMESFFLAESLKYLYLLLDEDNFYNSDQFVFNTEAHMFPIFKTFRTFGHDLEDPRKIIVDARGADLPIQDGVLTEYKGDAFDTVVNGLEKGFCPRTELDRACLIFNHPWDVSLIVDS